jgi:hypothetical protein
LIIIHRHHANAADVKRIKSWRDARTSRGSSALILCFSPYLRYAELERISGLFDQMVPEATAIDVLPGRVARLVAGGNITAPHAGGSSFRIEIACGTREVGEVLVETCLDAGYRAETVDESHVGEEMRPYVSPVSATERVLTIWEVPVLEAGWPDRIDRHATATGPMIALMGFAERSTVTFAKAKGASACLELPYDRDDLLDVIDRVVRSADPEKWPLPPRAEPSHVLPPRPRQRSSALTGTGVSDRSLWSDP